jgi:hypothetical protein
MTAVLTRTRVYLAATILSLIAVLQALPASAQHPASTQRTLSGTVTDTSHEPLRGAVVELQNPANKSVETFLTDAEGHYSFKRLDSDADYSVWVVFRGHHTPTRSISKFDSHLNKAINFEVKLH